MQWVHNCDGRLIDYNPLTHELHDEGKSIAVMQLVPDQYLEGQVVGQEIDICSRCKVDLTNNRSNSRTYYESDQVWFHDGDDDPVDGAEIQRPVL